MFENLSDRLERSFKILKGEGQITEINVAETLKDVRRALLDADVNYKVAKTFADNVKKKAMGMNVLTAVKPGQLMIKLVHDELAELMGGDTSELKLDGDTRGVAALSIRTVVTKPIKFVGTGEKMEAIDVFHPARMADRILGMGDIVSLVERAQEQFDEEEAKKLQRKIQKNKFDFNDFLNQIEQIKKMGNLKDLASMIPGVGKAIKDVDIDDNAFNGVEAIIRSMTPSERTSPEILNTSRRQRIAKGSGTSIQEVNKLIKQFDQTRKMMKMVTGNQMAGMMSRMKGMKMPGMPKL